MSEYLRTTGVRGTYGRPLLTLMVVVGLVLMIACGNIANLLLARANARRHEVSMRRALGASQFRLVRQLLTESFLLAGVGAVLGLALARWGSRLLLHQLSASGDRVVLDLSFDWRVIGFTAAVAIGTALLFGVAPALRAGRSAPSDVLKQQSHTLAGHRRHTVAHLLLVGQVALALVLVVAAGLFIRTLSALATVDLGFDRDPVLVVRANAQRSAVEPTQHAALFDRAIDAIAGVPGVARAAASSLSPLSGVGWNGTVVVPGAPPLLPDERLVYQNAVTPGWFATYGITLLAGRDFETRDRDGAPLVAIVNETFARRFFGERDPIGRMIDPGYGEMAIVGVVEDSVYGSVRETIPPTAYIPLAQMAGQMPTWQVDIAVRSAVGAPASLTRAIAGAIGDVDANVSLTFRPLADRINASLLAERLVAMLSAFFGTLALLLAAIGLYGVLSYAISQRRAEIGIRMALGADAASVVRLVLGRVALLVGVGVVIGAAASLWASRFVGALLYGLERHDPLTFVAAAGVLVTVGALVAWWPARRATRIDPARVLRES